MIEVSSTSSTVVLPPHPTISTFTSVPTPTPTPTSTSTTTEQKLTKKQKKALAFRDKSKKSAPTATITTVQAQVEDGSNKYTSMEDIHVTIMEKSNSIGKEGIKIEMGGLEGKNEKSTKGRGKETRKSEEGIVIRKEGKGEGESKSKSKRKSGKEDGSEVVQKDNNQQAAKKRKRDELDLGEEMEGTKVTKTKGKGKGREQGDVERSAKRRKGKGEGEGEEVESGLDKGENEDKNGEEGEGKKEVKGRENQKLILFVGNLKYTTSLEAIKAHFSECTPTPQVRLLTPKPSTGGRPVNKSKGCAFLEFSSRTGLQQALKLHQSMLDGRMINVELTAGGGGKSDKRMAKVRERNKELLGQRTRKAEKEEKLSKDGTLPSRPDRPQRYSSTSGIDQSTAPSSRRTWTVGDVADDEVHRGGKKHQKEKTRGARKSRGKDWSSGVNAIPVG